MQDTLPITQRMVDPDEFVNSDSMAPTALGFLAYHQDDFQPMELNLTQLPAMAPSQSLILLAMRRKGALIWRV